MAENKKAADEKSNDTRTEEGQGKRPTSEEPVEQSKSSEEQSGDATIEAHANDAALDLEAVQDKNESRSGKSRDSAIKQAEPDSKSGGKGTEKKRLSSGFWFLVLVLIVLSLVFSSALLVLRSGFESKLADFEKQREGAWTDFVALSAFENRSVEVQDELAALRVRVASQQEALRQLEQGAKAFNRRLLAMSTTSREDWQLAEAEYLLKLANQRVLIERKPDTAIGLLEDADAILRDLGDLDLLPLRKAIKADLLALKLSEKVDREGLYLELSTLAENLASLPLIPQRVAKQAAAESPENTQQDDKKSVLSSFIDSLSGYIRVIDHSDKPEAILPPEDTAYLHMNMRFMLERAQIALLREQQSIYEKNLDQALSWMKRYFPNSTESDAYEASLAALKGKRIAISLPDISHSLELLHDYIEMLHKTGETGEVNDSNAGKASAEAKI